ncbi:MAG: diphthine--ammonia ligase [Nanoarchaeota archaeon]
MKVGVLFSGGKDSCLALHKARVEGHEILYLLNINPASKDSWMFHKPELKLLKRQAKELGIELIIEKSLGEKEKELDDLRKLIGKVKNKVEGIVVGGIASSYQGNRVKKICDGFGLKFIAPLLDYAPEKLWKEMLDEGFEVILTKISCEGLDKKWAGRVIDKDNFTELRKLSEKHKFRLDFEGGEAESAVLFMPEFKNRIKLDFSIESEDKYRHFLKIKKIF